MTSRVQKGSAIFRPVKSRPRPENSQEQPPPQPPPSSQPNNLPSLPQATTITTTVFSQRTTPAPPIIATRPTPIPPQLSSSQFPTNPPLSQNVSSSNNPPSTPTIPPSNPILEQNINDPPSTSRPKRKSSTTSQKTLQKRKKSTSNDDPQQPDEVTYQPPRKRLASASRRSRGPSLPPFDPTADPGEEIDPTVVTMASLCHDTGQGRVSSKAAEILSNHATWKAQNKEKRARMKAMMELKKYGREEEAEALESSQTAAPVEKAPEGNASADARTSDAPVINDDSGNGFDYTQDLATSRFNVQVRIGPNGETVIDEESLVVDRVEAEDTTNYTHVVESDHTKFVNSGSYGKRYRGSRWSAEETELFFDALAQYGENYELIAYVLPGRDRKSCKNKFKAEDKKNPARINHALNNFIPVDMATLSRMTGKDFSGPVPEIRVSTPQPIVQPTEKEISSVETGNTAAAPQTRKKIKKRQSEDDGALVVGDADSFVPFPDSP